MSLPALRRLVAASRRWGPELALAVSDRAGGAGDAAGGSGGTGGAAPGTDDDAHRSRVEGLVTLAQQGDSEAFGQIYDSYVDGVYRYLYYRLGSHALAEDLTSETFLRALRSLSSFRWQNRDIGAWFITIARNLVADHVKSSRFRLEVSTADMLDADTALGGVEEDVLARLEQARVVDAVRQLKPEQQECLVLRFVHGLPVAETAAAMGRSVGAVKQLQLRAVRSLARLLPDITEDTEVAERADVTDVRSARLPGGATTEGRAPR